MEGVQKRARHTDLTQDLSLNRARIRFTLNLLYNLEQKPLGCCIHESQCLLQTSDEPDKSTILLIQVS